MHKEYQVSKDINFSWDFYDHAIEEHPSIATISIYDNSGTAVISSATLVIDSTGTLSYTLAAAKVTEGRNFKITLQYTARGQVQNVSYLYDVVKCPLRCEVSDNDLFLYLGELRDKVKERNIKITDTISGNAFLSSALTTDVRDYKGGQVDIFITASDTVTIKHEAKITSYVPSTGAVTFAPAYGSTIATNTLVTIRPSFQTYIDNAFNNHVMRDIRNKVNSYHTNLSAVASGYIDSTAVNNMVIYKTLELYCFAQVEEVDDKWSVRQKEFKQNYADEFIKIMEPFDADNDGDISTSENENRPNMVNIRIRR